MSVDIGAVEYARRLALKVTQQHEQLTEQAEYIAEPQTRLYWYRQAVGLVPPDPAEWDLNPIDFVDAPETGNPVGNDSTARQADQPEIEEGISNDTADKTWNASSTIPETTDSASQRTEAESLDYEEPYRDAASVGEGADNSDTYSLESEADSPQPRWSWLTSVVGRLRR